LRNPHSANSASVDFVSVESRRGPLTFSGEMLGVLQGLVDAGAIQLIDLLVLVKDFDGSWT
jgi:hypothetical protein